MKNKEKNYLKIVPCHTKGLNFKINEQGIVTLNIKNKGIFNKIAQKLLKKPEITHVHLDEEGSFVWLLIDGEKNIAEIKKRVQSRSFDKSAVVASRLFKFLEILRSYGFITLKN